MEGTLRSNIEGIKQASHNFGRNLTLRSKGDTQSIGNMTYCLALGVRTYNHPKNAYMRT